MILFAAKERQAKHVMALSGRINSFVRCEIHRVCKTQPCNTKFTVTFAGACIKWQEILSRKVKSPDKVSNFEVWYSK